MTITQESNMVIEPKQVAKANGNVACTRCELDRGAL